MSYIKVIAVTSLFMLSLNPLYASDIDNADLYGISFGMTLDEARKIIPGLRFSEKKSAGLSYSFVYENKYKYTKRSKNSEELYVLTVNEDGILKEFEIQQNISKKIDERIAKSRLVEKYGKPSHHKEMLRADSGYSGGGFCAVWNGKISDCAVIKDSYFVGFNYTNNTRVVSVFIDTFSGIVKSRMVDGKVVASDMKLEAKRKRENEIKNAKDFKL
jgi:hypothetical protein